MLIMIFFFCNDEECFPLKSCCFTNRNKSPWLTRDLIKLCHTHTQKRNYTKHHHHHQSSVDGVEEAAATCWAQNFLSFISLMISCSSSSMSCLMVSGYVILCLPQLLQPPVGVQKTRCATGWSAVRKQWPAKLSRLTFIIDVMGGSLP